ncbi:uncharacterized protein AMSG_09521 [Thecamonas trahens ATCC 50062]|uniref:Uncharacterized protein n=1 Tax=Thecamonas trahens ATCC 50062 TaxID=461836 RepID=A0A0L0DNB0_THETB|nr:hypothetical protein AMSG_09521 [Thecamonas trahens ATCC 50062]KNC53799.1 hypothetical protein AMSG_09521 [Thecamonas trahens ATCC 50062]|eukprot:XP_013754359.1 hypothetical protein AMSG_09521 [Thecamonas trahens ATCC 50062]
MSLSSGPSIFEAASQGDAVPLTEALVSGASVAATDAEGNSPLHLAAYAHRLANVRILLSFGADVKACNGKGWTPLHFAAIAGAMDVVRVLVDAGAPLDAATNDGERPLDFLNLSEDERAAMEDAAAAVAARKEAIGADIAGGSLDRMLSDTVAVVESGSMVFEHVLNTVDEQGDAYAKLLARARKPIVLPSAGARKAESQSQSAGEPDDTAPHGQFLERLASPDARTAPAPSPSRRVGAAQVTDSEAVVEALAGLDDDAEDVAEHFDAWAADMKAVFMEKFGYARSVLQARFDSILAETEARHAAAEAELCERIAMLNERVGVLESALDESEANVRVLDAHIIKLDEQAIEADREAARRLGEERRVGVAKSMHMVRHKYAHSVMRRVLLAWHRHAAKKKVASVERVCAMRVEEATRIVVDEYSERLETAEARIAELEEALAAAQFNKKHFEDHMKSAFMRGVSALNIEAIELFGGKPEEYGSFMADVPSYDGERGSVDAPASPPRASSTAIFADTLSPAGDMSGLGPRPTSSVRFETPASPRVVRRGVASRGPQAAPVSALQRPPQAPS